MLPAKMQVVSRSGIACTLSWRPWCHSRLSQRVSLHVGNPLVATCLCTIGHMYTRHLQLTDRWQRGAATHNRVCAAWLSVQNLHACIQGHRAICSCCRLRVCEVRCCGIAIAPLACQLVSLLRLLQLVSSVHGLAAHSRVLRSHTPVFNAWFRQGCPRHVPTCSTWLSFKESYSSGHSRCRRASSIAPIRCGKAKLDMTCSFYSNLGCCGAVTVVS
jgi:hypothetical protein